MDGLAVSVLDNGDSVFGLALEYLHPAEELNSHAVTRDMVALITALEGQSGARVGLQVVGRPEPKSPERGVLEVHVLGVVVPQDAPAATAMLLHTLADDLEDLLCMPPLRWSFRPVTDEVELQRVLHPLAPHHLAEIVRREEPCQPLGISRAAGYRADVDLIEVDRPLWSMWTMGPPSADMRRLASVLLAQSAPVAIRVSLAPTSLTSEEREAIEHVAVELDHLLGGDGLVKMSLRTIQSLLYLRPLFEMQCVVASADPLSRALLSALGHSMSEPADHGANDVVLRGGFSVLRDGLEVPAGTLAPAFSSWRAHSAGQSLAPESLHRLRRLAGAWEAANVFRLPIADADVFPGLERFDLPLLPAPVAALAQQGTRLGRLVGQHDSSVMVEDDERFRHLYVSGQTGTGKSTLLFNLALQDIERGAGVAVLDPHGDLVESLLGCIPEERLDDVVLVDPADPVAVVGVNLLEAESDVQRQYLVSEICAMFYAMFDPHRQGIIGPRYESMLRAAAGLLLARPDHPSSLLDLPTVFSDRAVRDFLLEGLSDPILVEYWLGDVAQNRSNELAEVLSWFRAKFEVFRMSPLVRNVIGQARSTISFSDVLSQRRILLVNLSKGLLGEYNSALLGQVMFMRLWGASLERAAIAREDRSDFFIYIDEFQNMTTDSLPSVLSEARKFRVGLTLANQFFSQVPESTRDAIMGNVGSRVTFRLGPKDSVPFSVWMGSGVRADDLTSLPNFHSVASLSQRGVPLDAFVMRSDPPRSVDQSSRAERARERSRTNWARPVGQLDDEFFSRWAHIPGSFSHTAARQAPPSEAPPASQSSFLDDWLAKRSPDTPPTPPDQE